MATAVSFGAGPADAAAGFTTQVQTPVSSLNEKSILIGEKEGGTATLAYPAGATAVRSRLYFGAADLGALVSGDPLLQTVSLTVVTPGPTSVTSTVVANVTDLLLDGGGYRYVADVTALVPVNATSVTVSGIEGTRASWALLGIYSVVLPAGQRSQVTYTEGFTKVSSPPNGPDVINFTGLAPANPASTGTLRVAAAAGTAAAAEGVSFDPDGPGPATEQTAIGTNNFDVSGATGKVAMNVPVLTGPGGTTAKLSFDPPPGAGGDTYFVMVAAYEVTFSVAELTLTQTLSDATPASTPPPDTFQGDRVGVAVSVANGAGRSAATDAVYSATLPAGTTVAGGKVYTDSTKATELAPARFTVTPTMITVGVAGDLPAGGQVVTGSPVGFYYELATTRGTPSSLTVTGAVDYKDAATAAPQPPATDTSAALALPAAADLSINTLDGVPPSIDAGTNFVVSATVHNAGPSDTLDGEAKVTITVGAGLTITAQPPPAANCTSTPTSVTCPVSALTKGSNSAPSPGVTIAGTNSPGTRTVTASVATTPVGLDPVNTLASNTKSADVVIIVRPNVTVTPTPATQRIVFGTGPTKTFTTAFTIHNDAIQAVSGLVVEVPVPTVPAGTTLTLDTLVSTNGTVCTTAALAKCTYAGSFAVNTTDTITATWTINKAAAGLAFAAHATAPNPTPVDKTGTQTVDVVSADLSINSLDGVPANIDAGTSFVVSATVHNGGPSATIDGEATVTISIPAGISIVTVPATCTSTATSVTCPVPGIGSGSNSPASPGVTLVGTSPPGTRTITAAVATNPAVLDPVNTPASNTKSADVVVIVRPNVTVTPTPVTQRIPFGDGTTRSFSTVFTVSNDNKQAVMGLEVRVPAPTVPAGTLLQLDSLTSANGAACTTAAPAKCTYAANFPMSSSDTITASWTISLPASGLAFVARAVAPNPTPVDTSGTQTVDVVSVDLEATLSGVPATLELGPPTTFSAHFTGINRGPSTTGTGTNASVLSITWDAGLTATVPAGCSLTSPTSATCTLPALAPNGQASFDLVFTGTMKGNRALTVVAKAPGADTPATTDNEEPTSKVDGKNTATATVRVITTPGFTLTATPPIQRVPVYPVPAPPSTGFDVTYTLANDNKADIDGLVVKVITPGLPPVPAGRSLSAIAVLTPTGPAGACTIATVAVVQTTTCSYTLFPKSTTGTIKISYVLTGTSPADLPLDFPANATASPNTPLVATANAHVDVVEAKADLVVSVTYGSPATNNVQVATAATTGSFDAIITVKNLGPDNALSPKITFTPGANIAVSSPNTGVSCVVNVCAITGGSMAKDEQRVLTIRFLLTATNNAVHVRSAPFVVASDTVDPVSTNNSGTVDGRINRAPLGQPDTGLDGGPAVPSGGTLTFKTFGNGDLDPDTDALKPIVGTATFSTPGGGATTITPTVTIVASDDGTLRITPSLPAGAPSGRVVKISIPVNVVDSQGGSAPSSLDLAVTEAVAATVEGSFGKPPTAPGSFGSPVPTSQIDDTASPIDVLKDALGKDADNVAFPAAISYNLTDVSKDSLNVAGSNVVLQDVAGKNVASYVPARGYTSDPGGVPSATAPPDDFTYVTKALVSGAERFRVEAGVSVEVKNQNPIGIDSIFDVPNGVTQVGDPASNDIDGNTVAAPIAVKRPTPGSFTFDDEGVLKPEAGLRILCIGPVPALDPVTHTPSTLPDAVCPTSGAAFTDGWKKPGEVLVLETPDSHGKVTVKLKDTGPDAFRSVSMTADATSVGNLDFAYVVADRHGGAGFGLATARVPNTPPQVIEGVRTVIKNTPTLVVDTKLATQDANGDTIKVSSAPEVTEQGGKVVIGDGNRTITYTPKKDYLGPDKLLYNVSDGRDDGAASAVLQLNVIEQPTNLTAAGTGAGGAGGTAAGSPAGSLAKTGGDPLPLTAAAGCSLLLGLALVQAGRRRGSRPLLDRARHLRT